LYGFAFFVNLGDPVRYDGDPRVVFERDPVLEEFGLAFFQASA
jgi:hypothetical protein